ncbi:FMN-binding protein [Psychromarinibacter sp. C21-152]|uniref:Na(+)-translocating NADH-quinone reductase subunit C n=1 Tax=Psychromarinibacter sediminicola TaxID=3033385 RepID=A0AAE3T9I1_9RHOB|nr:FMN-binding protein [Psychromarinibacter sediminicola]MDF0601868.1 FMN-binding protein [Psychromarinibacter sediminicola]
MADTGPFAAWKRFLALPNDSRGKTIAVAFAVATACAVAVTGATAILRPIQAANRAAEEQLRLESLIAAIPGMTDLLAQSEDGAISTVVVDLEEGAAAEGVDPASLDTALADAANWTELSPAEDIAGLGARPDYAQIYILRDADGALQLVILPIAGQGYNGTIQAMLALHGDMRTIAGMTVTQQQETPGLGARIEEPAWQASFAGKQFIDDLGNLRFAVAKGVATSPYEVDGITGATRTSTAMTRIVRFWLGPDGYGPVIEAMRDGEF